MCSVMRNFPQIMKEGIYGGEAVVKGSVWETAIRYLEDR